MVFKCPHICPLYPGIQASTHSSRSSSIDSISTYNSSQNHHSSSQSKTNHSDSSQTVTESLPYYPPSLNNSLKSMEINTLDNIMIFLPTNPYDEDIEYNPKRKRAPPQICNHIKYPIKKSQN